MAGSKPLIAVLEWNTDSGREPYVILADNAADLHRAAVNMIQRQLPTEEQPKGEVNYIDSTGCVSTRSLTWTTRRPSKNGCAPSSWRPPTCGSTSTG